MSRIPRKLDKVWKEERHLSGKQPNGYISRVSVGDECAYVTYLSSDLWHPIGGDMECLYFYELEDKYQGQQLGYLFPKDG